MTTFDAQYDPMRHYLLHLGFKEVRPYVFEETKELRYAVFNAPDYAFEGAGTWGKAVKNCEVRVRLTKREKEELISFCERNCLNQSEAVRQALRDFYKSQK